MTKYLRNLEQFPINERGDRIYPPPDLLGLKHNKKLTIYYKNYKKIQNYNKRVVSFIVNTHLRVHPLNAEHRITKLHNKLTNTIHYKNYKRYTKYKITKNTKITKTIHCRFRQTLHQIFSDISEILASFILVFFSTSFKAHSHWTLSLIVHYQKWCSLLCLLL